MAIKLGKPKYLSYCLRVNLRELVELYIKVSMEFKGAPGLHKGFF